MRSFNTDVTFSGHAKRHKHRYTILTFVIRRNSLLASRSVHNVNRISDVIMHLTLAPQQQNREMREFSASVHPYPENKTTHFDVTFLAGGKNLITVD